MKKQYVFIIMILIIFYLSFSILNFSYKEYRINSSIEYIKKIIKEGENKIDTWRKIIEYKTSKAYKNKVLKEQQSMKNKWEIVIYFTSEENFNKYTNDISESKENKNTSIIEEKIENKIKNLTIWEKWMYFIFRKHPDSEN